MTATHPIADRVGPASLLPDYLSRLGKSFQHNHIQASADFTYRLPRHPPATRDSEDTAHSSRIATSARFPTVTDDSGPVDDRADSTGADGNNGQTRIRSPADKWIYPGARLSSIAGKVDRNLSQLFFSR